MVLNSLRMHEAMHLVMVVTLFLHVYVSRARATAPVYHIHSVYGIAQLEKKKIVKLKTPATVKASWKRGYVRICV